MPNWVKNIVKMPGIVNLPLFSEEDGATDFDFNKLIPMPVELNMESGSMTERFIVYFLTERCTIPIQDLDPIKNVPLNKLVTNMLHPPAGRKRWLTWFGNRCPVRLAKSEIRPMRRDGSTSPTMRSTASLHGMSGVSITGEPSGMHLIPSFPTRIRSCSIPHGAILSRSL